MKAAGSFAAFLFSTMLVSFLPAMQTLAAEEETAEIISDGQAETVTDDETVSDEEVASDEEAASFSPVEIETYSEASSSFLACVNGSSDAYTDETSGVTYTQTSSGRTVEVSGNAFENAMTEGDQETYLAILDAQRSSFYWDGSILTADAGINYGPSGKETYYSLDMSTCISVMQDCGVSGEYWVREDGCQMYGIYILCAADYNQYALGSTVETSLGTAIVADTGNFSNLIDIATNWAY